MLNLAINYGARSELCMAVKKIAECVTAGEIAVSDIDESTIESNLYTAGLPELDLIIRTAGEQRLSNFLLYQVAYAELVFVNTYFPDFGEAEYAATIAEFQKRSRRYGGL